jgi:hypothetical protein
MAKMIKFSVTSMEGDTEYSLLPKQAVNKIKSLAREQNKWVYIGGEIQNTELLTEKSLVSAMDDEEEIILMNAIAGGDCPKPVRINFETVKKLETSISIGFYETDDVKVVDITVDKDDLIDVIHDREVIVNAIAKKLEEFAAREVEGLRTALKY